MGRIVFAAMVIGGLVLSSICFGYSGGSGTAEDPYQIADANDLLALAADANDYGKCFILTADVNLQGQVFTTAIIAVDTSSDYDFQGTAFRGTFDGNSHKITHFTISGGSNDYLGLFGYIYTGGSVKNLGLENCAVSGVSDSHHVGGLVGYNDGSISDCYSTGSVSSSQVVGGLVGGNGGGSNISNCYSTGAVSGYSDVGGLVGGNYGSISNCYSTGAVSGYYDVGGLVGFNYGSISDCYSTGVVGGSGYVGGLVGWNYSGGSISNCYSTGAVSGSSNSQYVGGLVGLNSSNGNISNCYSTGTVSGTSYVGGLVGGNGGSISSCYFLDTSGSDNDYGEPLTDEQMKQQASFTAWDFMTIWAICEGTNYPRLTWQIPAADFTCPDGVNIEDLYYFVQRWLMTDCGLNNDCDGTDMNTDGTVNFVDFALFAQDWLEM